MAPQFETVEIEIGNVIEIEDSAPMWKMPNIMSKNFSRIFKYLTARNCKAKEAPFARYLEVDWEALMKNKPLRNFIEIFTKRWHFLVGVATSEKLNGEGVLKASTLPKRKFVKTIHRGPYRNIGKTYKGMYRWVKDQGLIVENESIEYYLNDPRTTRKEDLETMVLIPIARAGTEQNHI